jgi:hypothetical protein
MQIRLVVECSPETWKKSDRDKRTEAAEMISFNPLKPKLAQIIFKDSVHASKRTTHFTITKIMLFKEIITAYIETHKRPIHTYRMHNY